MKRAQILLKTADGQHDEEIIAALSVGHSTVERIRRRFVEGGIARALNEDPRPGQARKLDGRGEAQLIALTCSERPDGQARWSVRLLADKLVELGVVEHISHETVRQTLKKTTSSPGK
jgi:transposase